MRSSLPESESTSMLVGSSFDRFPDVLSNPASVLDRFEEFDILPALEVLGVTESNETSSDSSERSSIGDHELDDVPLLVCDSDAYVNAFFGLGSFFGVILTSFNSFINSGLNKPAESANGTIVSLL